jgi:hypothetical protein
VQRPPAALTLGGSVLAAAVLAHTLRVAAERLLRLVWSLACPPVIVLFSQDESTSQQIVTSNLGKNLAEPMEFPALSL